MIRFHVVGGNGRLVSRHRTIASARKGAAREWSHGRPAWPCQKSGAPLSLSPMAGADELGWWRWWTECRTEGAAL